MYGIFLSHQDRAVERRCCRQRNEEVQDVACHEGPGDSANREDDGGSSSRDSFSTITTAESTRIQSVRSDQSSSKYSNHVPSEIVLRTPSLSQGTTNTHNSRDIDNGRNLGLDDFPSSQSQPPVFGKQHTAERHVAYSHVHDTKKSTYSRATSTHRRRFTDDGLDYLDAPGRKMEQI